MKILEKLDKKQFLIAFCLIILFLQAAQIIYFQRETFLTTYDAPYWTDRVEHSRYMLPRSERGLNDDSFYAYGGYKLLQGHDPTKVVYDKPALGLFFIGIFSSWVNNPAFSGLFFGIGILLVTYFIFLKVTKNSLIALVTSLFLLLDLTFVYNLSTSALDLPQLFFLLINILLILYASNKKLSGHYYIFIAGLALGIFAQIKIPVIYPFIFLLEVIYLYKLFNKSKIVLFILGNISALFVGYLPYLANGYSFIDFINIQKFILAFYKDSKVPLQPETMWQFLFTGTLPGLTDGTQAKVSEWSVIYPIITISGIVYSVLALTNKKEKYSIKGFAFIILISLFIFTVIPSYPRYVILILPFLYFFTVLILFNRKQIIQLVVIVLIGLYSLISTFTYLNVSPTAFLSGFYSNLSQQYFHDIYQIQLDSNTKKFFTRDEFNNIGLNTYLDAKIKSIEINEEFYQASIFDERVIVPIVVTYKTEYLGTVTEKKNILLIKENDKWKVAWNWGYLINGFDKEDSIVTERTVGKRGKIMDNDQNILVQDSNGYLISFNPSLMNGEQEKDMLALFTKLSYVKVFDIQNAYLENPPLNKYIPLFTINYKLSQKELDTVRSFSGVKVEEYPSRIYSGLDPKTIGNTQFTECCTRIYSSFNYHGIKGFEQKYDNELLGYDGGTLMIVDKYGNTKRVILQKDKKDGKDIILPE